MHGQVENFHDVVGSLSEEKLATDHFLGLRIKQRLTTTNHVQLNFKFLFLQFKI